MYDESKDFSQQSFVRKVIMHKAKVDMTKEATKKLIDELWLKYDTTGNERLDDAELRRFFGDIQGKLAMDVEQDALYGLIRSKVDDDGNQYVEKAEMTKFVE